MTKNYQRVRKKKKRRKKRYLLKFFILIVLAVGLYYFLTSSLFDIGLITVENNSYYTQEQIISIAEGKTGGNIFEASTSEMKERLLENPYIKNAEVKRRLPSTLHIEVEERKESASIPYGEEYIIIDNDGIVLRKAEVEPALTMLTGLTVKNMDDGTPLVVEENAMLTDTLNLLKEVEKHELFFKRIDIANIVIKGYIYDQLICEGTPDNITNNLDALQIVLYDLYTKGIERGTIKMGSEGLSAFNPSID
ncbi:MAG: cell division protein FtsQ/DivIB [Anaerovoracaceae bacterium]|jgi:cell division protein FtsQ